MKISRAHGINTTILNQLSESNIATATSIHSARGKNWGSSPKSYSFTISCLEMFYNEQFSKKELSKIITDGYNDASLDAIRIHPNGTIDVFDIKKNTSLGSKDLSFLKGSIETNVLEEPRDYTAFNKIVSKNIKAIHGIEKPAINIFIIRDTGASTTTYFNKMVTDLNTFSKVRSVELITVNDLVCKKMDNESYRGSWEIKTDEECLHRFEKDKELTLRIPLEKIIELHSNATEAGSNLFHRNIRGFLKKKYLSDGITKTLNEEPRNFYYYHNGLTLVVKSITIDGPHSFTVLDPQVINGAQTINSVSSSIRENKIKPTNLKKAYILCKIYVANADETEKMCETSNTQVKVEPSDLRANDEIQISLESLINGFPKTSFEYIRKKPYTRKCKGTDLITLPEFTQWVYAVLFEKPASAKNDKRLLFDATAKGLYKKIFIDDRRMSDAATILRICKVGVFVRKMIKKEKDSETKGILRSANLHLMAALYATSGELSKTRFNKLKRIVCDYARTQQNANPGISSIRIFSSSEEPWKHIKKKFK